MLVIQNLDSLIDDAWEYAVKIRRELHEYPEMGNDEFVTAGIIERELLNCGIEGTRPLPTAVVASFTGLAAGGAGGEARKKIFLCADMDALSIDEETNLEFSSKRINMMHACGHDVHMSIMLGVAMILEKIKYLININIKFIFQPDEEGSGGAERLIKRGVLEGERRKTGSIILGIHVCPELQAGFIGLKYGKVHAASIMFKLCIKGQKSHGARPEEAKDSIVAAAAVISAAQTIVSRNMNPLHSAVLSFGRIRGGDAPNIIADKVILEGIIRGEDQETCNMVMGRLQEVSEYIGKAMEVSVRSDFKEGYPALVNDDEIVNLVNISVRECNKFYGSSRVHVAFQEGPSMTVDDFAYYLNEMQGAYLFLGSGYKGRENPGIHTSTFQVDEACIKTGIQTIMAVILNCLD